MANTLTELQTALESAEDELVNVIKMPINEGGGFRSNHEQKVAALRTTIQVLNQQINALKGVTTITQDT